MPVFPRFASRLLLAGTLALVAQLALTGGAFAAAPNPDSLGALSGGPSGHGGGGGGGGQARAGFDIAYPQCGAPYPANPLFGIVGVNGGKVFSANPCLAGEIAWAGGATGQLYANTGNPGPALSSFWPSGQTSPRYCDPANLDTADCAYDYGFNAAQHSYNTASAAYAQLHLTGSPSATRWWLDVETENSWRSDTSLNIAALQGEVAYLRDIAGVARIGFYSTQLQWNTITAGTLAFNVNPSWVAGASSLKAARDRCTRPAFTGNVNVYTQYPYLGFDANNVC
ncbi:MAG: hypothetical protein QOI92_2893 [Chloroflexota bacterium]|nr:hypothetical protein [Chloroflexota bacterium]